MAAPKVDRPSQYKQSSRKGKKAWRKNIDISDIEQSIETKREQEITHGKSNISDLKNDDLFQVDTSGDDVLKNKLIKRKQIKKNLKSTEILEAIKTNSKVGALVHHKHDDNQKKAKKVQGVSKRELNKLMALAGRVHGESKIKNRTGKDGLVKSKTFDLWGDNSSNKHKLPSGIEVDAKIAMSVDKDLVEKSTTSWSLPSVKPDTIDRETVQIREFKEIPHAGKSYNPNKRDWSDLISTEFDNEKINEAKRVALQEYRERIQHLMDTIDDNEEESSSEDDDNEEDEDEENEEEDTSISLSLNKPAKLKKKTKYQRNKAKRHEEKMKLQDELKKLREQIHQLEKFEEIEVEVLQKTEKQVKELEDKNKIKKRRQNRNKMGTKYGILDERLEVKFSDELSDSLRKLKPEGNLLYDNVRKLQSSGKIESRVPVKRGRRYKQKITEKWTYKDFK